MTNTELNKIRYLFISVLFTLAGHLVHGQRFSTIVLRPLDKSDTLAKFLDIADVRTIPQEKEKHKLVWKIDEVRKSAISLKAKGVETFTMTDEVPNEASSYYVIGFYEMLTEHYTRLKTYRISKDLTMESYNFSDDTWTKIK